MRLARLPVVKLAVTAVLCSVILMFAVRSLAAIRAGNLAPWTNYFGAPVTPGLVTVIGVLVVVALLIKLWAPADPPERKDGRSPFRRFKRRGSL